MATKKDDDAPVLGTGAVGDPEKPAVGSPVDQAPADPEQTDKKSSKKSDTEDK